MISALKNWINSNRDYWTGVALLAQYEPSLPLMPILRLVENARNKERLFNAIETYYDKHNTKTAVVEKILPAVAPDAPKKKIESPVYDAAKQRADHAYKQVMNLRAELFASTRLQEWEDPNTPDKVASRAKLAIQVIEDYRKSSSLYEIADFVSEHGHLPNAEQTNETDYEALPDHFVKQTIDNLRKNISKRKKLEQTAERIELIAKHESSLQKLLARWDTLK